MTSYQPGIAIGSDDGKVSIWVMSCLQSNHDFEWSFITQWSCESFVLSSMFALPFSQCICTSQPLDHCSEELWQDEIQTSPSKIPHKCSTKENCIGKLLVMGVSSDDPNLIELSMHKSRASQTQGQSSPSASCIDILVSNRWNCNAQLLASSPICHCICPPLEYLPSNLCSSHIVVVADSQGNIVRWILSSKRHCDSNSNFDKQCCAKRLPIPHQVNETSDIENRERSKHDAEFTIQDLKSVSGATDQTIGIYSVSPSLFASFAVVWNARFCRCIAVVPLHPSFVNTIIPSRIVQMDEENCDFRSPCDKDKNGVHSHKQIDENNSKRVALSPTSPQKSKRRAIERKVKEKQAQSRRTCDSCGLKKTSNWRQGWEVNDKSKKFRFAVLCSLCGDALGFHQELDCGNNAPLHKNGVSCRISNTIHATCEESKDQNDSIHSMHNSNSPLKDRVIDVSVAKRPRRSTKNKIYFGNKKDEEAMFNAAIRASLMESMSQEYESQSHDSVSSLDGTRADLVGRDADIDHNLVDGILNSQEKMSQSTSASEFTPNQSLPDFVLVGFALSEFMPPPSIRLATSMSYGETQISLQLVQNRIPLSCSSSGLDLLNFKGLSNVGEQVIAQSKVVSLSISPCDGDWLCVCVSCSKSSFVDGAENDLIHNTLRVDLDCYQLPQYCISTYKSPVTYRSPFVLQPLHHYSTKLSPKNHDTLNGNGSMVSREGIEKKFSLGVACLLHPCLPVLFVSHSFNSVCVIVFGKLSH